MVLFIKKESMGNETRTRLMLNNLRKSIKKDFGSKCKIYEPLCIVCRIYYALEEIEGLYHDARNI